MCCNIELRVTNFEQFIKLFVRDYVCTIKDIHLTGTKGSELIKRRELPKVMMQKKVWNETNGQDVK